MYYYYHFYYCVIAIVTILIYFCDVDSFFNVSGKYIKLLIVIVGESVAKYLGV